MKRSLCLFAGALFLFCGAARAEMIQGMITYLDPANDLLSLKPTAPAKTNPPQRLIQVKDGTVTRNVGSVGDLRVGQVVLVEASPNEVEKIMEAKSIELKALTSA